MSIKSKDQFWISEEHLNGSKELIDQSKEEFYNLPILNQVASESDDSEAKPSASRRDFLKYLGFSIGAATVAAACDTPIRRAIPYVNKPDSIVPGVATYYASTFTKGGDFCPVLVKTREGRPIKIEGNILSPLTKGATTARVQASVLELYDTSRYTGPGLVDDNGKLSAMTWEDVDRAVMSKLTPSSNVRIVSNTILSPSTKSAVQDFSAIYPNTKHYCYDPYSSSALVSVHERMTGQRGVPSYDFSKAKSIVTIGADFLGTWIAPAMFARQYAEGRKVGVDSKEMSYLVAVESSFSLTGTNADDRIQIKPSEQGVFIAALYNEIAAAKSMSAYRVGSVADHIKEAAKSVSKNLLSSPSSLIVSDSNNQVEQELVAKMNMALGAYGSTIAPGTLFARQGKDSDLAQLVQDLNANTADIVIFLEDVNPVYDSPYGVDLKNALSKATMVVSTSSMPNETAAVSQYVCPQGHYLENWSDVQITTDVVAVVQPTINRLFDTRSIIETLLTWSQADGRLENGDDRTMHYIQENWKSQFFTRQTSFATFESFWDTTVHDGTVTLNSGQSPIVDLDISDSSITKPLDAELEIKFFEPVGVGSGQYANNPWLQEMPDPVTRVVWDNPLHIPIKWKGGHDFDVFARFEEDGEYADIKISDVLQHQVPIVKQFGQPEKAVSLALGYGRSVCGNAGRNIGVRVVDALSIDQDGNVQYFSPVASVNKTGKKDKIYASVQHHHTLGVTGEVEDGKIENVDEKTVMTVRPGDKTNFQGGLTNRTIIRQSNADSLEESINDLRNEREHIDHLNKTSIYPGHEDKYATGHHWGLAVDLSSCIGCGACQVACVAENNVPVVGKKEVFRHHEMTWLRIDRYYYGDANNPNVVYQPMMCQHCDNAPCENVCPVAATPHSSEGLNQMTYNRCVGTRYCANNCPYKVRRFNWLDYTTADTFFANENNPIDSEEPFYASNLTRMVLNPDVTVRSRGVIEKCSMCVQRIQEGKLKAKSENRALQDGDIKTACQTACPTGGIVFGDMNDENSELVSRLNDGRNYYVLEEVNVRPSVGYQMKVTNKKLFDLHVNHGQVGKESSTANHDHGSHSH